MTTALARPELPLVFTCAGEELLGILHPPGKGARVRGVLIVVGGPQYRVGSHRQFVLLARALAAQGYPAMRFDYRGMGDSGGGLRDFEGADEDIGAAIEAFFHACPGMSEVVLWGLCDAASAAASLAYRDERIAGLVLLNPWVRTEAGEARTQLRHYYLTRLREPEFWRRLLTFRWNPLRSLAEVAGAVRRLASPSAGDGTSSVAGQALPERMRAGLERFAGPVLVLLSGRDLTAREFEDTVAASSRWRAWMDRDRVTIQRFPEADHTFSRAAWRAEVEAATCEWLGRW